MTSLLPVVVVVNEELEAHWRAAVTEAAAVVGAEIITMTATEPDAAMLARAFSVALDRDPNAEPDAQG
jgi:hypothetical protein